MKILAITVVSLLLLGKMQAQALQTIKTYHDPLTKTQLFEVYIVKANTPIKHGTYKAYDVSGTLVEEATLSNNLINGVHKVYFGYEWNESNDYRVGKIQLVENFVNGVQVGLSEQYQYIKGEKFFLWQKTYDSKGNLIKEVEYHKSNGAKAASRVANGLCYEWYEGGKRLSEYIFKNSVPDGKYTSWHENGGIKEEGQFNNGQKTGVWKTYTGDGTLEKDETF